MLHIKLTKICISALFFGAAAYITAGAAAYIFADALSKNAVMFFSAASVSLWCGLFALAVAASAWIVMYSGLNKTGSARPFICSQLIAAGSTAILVGSGIALFILIFAGVLGSIGTGGVIFRWWDKMLFAFYFLPPVAAMAVSCAAMRFYEKESLPPEGKNLPPHPYAGRMKAAGKAKFVVVAIETAAAVLFYLFIVFTAALL